MGNKANLIIDFVKEDNKNDTFLIKLADKRQHLKFMNSAIHGKRFQDNVNMFQIKGAITPLNVSILFLRDKVILTESRNKDSRSECSLMNKTVAVNYMGVRADFLCNGVLYKPVGMTAELSQQLKRLLKLRQDYPVAATL